MTVIHSCNTSVWTSVKTTVMQQLQNSCKAVHRCLLLYLVAAVSDTGKALPDDVKVYFSSLLVNHEHMHALTSAIINTHKWSLQVNSVAVIIGTGGGKL